MIGSVREARRAGRYVANRATVARPAATVTYVTGSVGLTPNSNADMTRVTTSATPMPSCYAGACQQEPVTEKQPAHISGLRAERHADSDLTRPLRRDVGNHAIDPHDAEEQRHSRGNRQHNERERRLRHRIRLNLVQRPHACQRQVRIDGPDGLLEFAQEARRARPIRSDHIGHGATQVDRYVRPLLDQHRPIHDGRRRLVDAIVAFVSDDTDDFPPGIQLELPDPLAERRRQDSSNTRARNSRR